MDKRYEYIIITGCTGSGKSTLARKLCEKDGYEYHKKYTTRKRRENDPTDDMEYQFVNDDEFLVLKEKENIATMEVTTAMGLQKYGFPPYDIHDDGITRVQVLGLKDIEMFLNHSAEFPRSSLMIILFVDESSIKKKLSEERGDIEEELQRRLTHEIGVLGDSPMDYTKLYCDIRQMVRDSLSDFAGIPNNHYTIAPDRMCTYIANRNENRGTYTS